MDQITCKHCGTKYPAEVSKCPVCGASNLPNISGDFAFLDDDFEVTDEEAVLENVAAPAEPAASAASKDSVSKDTGAYNWEDIIAEINGTKPADKEVSAEEPETEQIPQEPEKAAPAAVPAWKQSSAGQDDDDEDDEDEDEPRPVRRPRERKQKSKTGSTVLIVVLIAAVLVAAFFAAKHFGLFDKAEPEQEPETPELPVVQEQDVDCTGVTLSANALTLSAEGASETLTVTLTPDGCTEKINWVSADPSIAVVDGNGKVTAVAEGTANILVSCGDYAATCLVTVDFTPEEEGGEEPEDLPGTTEPAEEDGEMKLNHEDITIRYPGDQVQLKVENCGDKTVTWTSDNETILKVDETGLVTALGTGTANVRAEVDGQTFSCIVRLPLGGTEGEAVTVSLNKTDISMFYEGEQFKLEVEYEQGAPEGVTYEWKSVDESVCTVDADGIITAVGNGTTDVLTTVDGVVLRCIVRVRIEASTTGG